MTAQAAGKNKDQTDKSLFLFFPATDQLGNVFQNNKSLTKLTIIGQNVDSFTGIEELKRLEELWVVECKLQQQNVEPICKCTSLKRLYLYDNELNAIPNMESLVKLSHLWLSDNQIGSIEGINNLSNVRELCLSNNNIATIDVKLNSKLKIVFLNLAGNPFKSVKEIQKLEALRKLQWLVLSDPLFRTSPVTLLANLRLMVIHCLPHLEKLDMLHISQAERADTSKFFDSKLQYYRLSLHNTLAKLYENSHKHTIELEIKELEVIWSVLKSHCPSLKKDEESKSNNLRFWEDESHRWKERFKLLHHKYEQMTKVIAEAFNLEVESCGNLKYLELDLSIGGVQDKMKNKILSFACSHLRRNVLDVKVENAWFVQGHNLTAVDQSQFQDSFDHVYIVSPISNLNIQPLKFVNEVLFGNMTDEKLIVSKCLAQADSLVADDVSLHRQLLLRSQTLLSSRLMVICGISDQSELADSSQEAETHSCGCGCNRWLIQDSSLLVPLYVLHYQYIFQDYFKPLKMSPVEGGIKHNPLPPSLDGKVSQHITMLQLTACNIHKLDIPLMEHVTTVDLSYNHLEDISSLGSIFPKLTTLNVAFNRIKSLIYLQGLQNINHLTMSWNFLSDFLNTLRSLKSMITLKHVDVSNNPFRDVTSDLHQQFFVCKHLKTLMTFNDYPLSRSLLRGEVMLQGQEQFPLVPAWRRHKTPLSLSWKANLADTDSENCLGLINNQVVSVILKGLKLVQFRSVFSLTKLKWLDLSDNLFSDLTSLKSSAVLEEVNLSHNVFEGFYCTSDKFKHLTKLNLSHNYISSLSGLTCQAFPQLKILDLSNNRLQSLVGLSGLKTLSELYLSHNRLQDPNTFTNCKDFKDLRVLDVSYNPVVEADSFKSVCLYHMNSLKYLNGCKVRLSEAKSAVTLYEGMLDQDYLLRLHKSAAIDNLTQISLPNCYIKKVSLLGLTLSNVTLLNLDHNKISSLNWLHSFPNLVRLSLSHNRVASFGCPSPSPQTTTPSHFPSVKSLILDNNHVKNIPSLKLDLFPNLQFLMLNNNKISSLSGLKKNTQLEYLMLDKNKLLSIYSDQVGQLGNLQELYLERNSLTRLDFLRPLSKLRKLFIGHNKLVARSCLDPLADLPNLVELTVHGNPIFRSSKSYRDYLPCIPSLQLLEGHPVNKPK